MTRAMSLHRRVGVAGVAVVVVAFLLSNAAVFAIVRSRLLEGLGELADERAGLAAELAADHGTNELADHLRDVGIPATVTTADGQTRTVVPAGPRLAGELPTPAHAALGPVVSATVALNDGASAVVHVRRSGVDRALRVLAAAQGLATAAGVLLGWTLLTRTTRRALRPLQDVTRVAGLIAAGQRHQRIQAHRSDTEIGVLADALNQMLEALQAALDHAEAADARSRQFLADAAHQLRTPIAGVGACVDALIRQLPAQDHDRLLGDLARESDRAASLIADLLRLGRLDSHPPTTRQPCDLVAICSTETQRIAARRPDLTIHLHAPTAAWVQAHTDDLAEALSNLLDNASRHATSRIDLCVTADHDDIVVHISDDGEGVPAENRDRIFDRFATLDGHRGCGLGLPIARSLARTYDGELHYDGAAFVITIPAASPPGPPDTAAANPAAISTEGR